MPAIEEGRGIDPVPEWRLKVWAQCGPQHRMLACDREGKYRTVFDTADKNEARRWWLDVQCRRGTAWKGWVWLAYYGWKGEDYGIRKLMLFPQ